MLGIATNLDSAFCAQAEDLKSYGIHITARLDLSRPLPPVNGSPLADLALLDFSGSAVADHRELIEHLEAQGIAVVIMSPSAATNAHTILLEGASAVVPRDVSAAGLACALWSAHHQAGMRHHLLAQVEKLRSETQMRKVIDQAKAIIGQQSQISEGEALRNLRREARNRRRPMHELAQIVVDAHGITNAVDSSNGSPPVEKKKLIAHS